VIGARADMQYTIRPALASDFPSLKAIEVDAFETLRATGAVSGAATSSSVDDLQYLLDHGLLLVATDAVDTPVGYVGASFPDGWLYVSEIDVARAWQRKGIGRALMLAVLAEGRKRGLCGSTLTTDRHAPFNAAFYASLGFRPLEANELSDHLSKTLAKEYAAGLDPLRRMAMLLPFGAV
jgi:predicted N-acetyltransferase YhbS